MIELLQAVPQGPPLPPVVQTPLQMWLNFLAPLCSTLVTGFLAYMVSRMGARQDASNVRQEGNLAEIKTFTNSALGAALRAAAGALRNLATASGKPSDLKAAEIAEAQAAAHEAAQKVVNAQHEAMPIAPKP
jgi:hypothetical protein